MATRYSYDAKGNLIKNAGTTVPSEQAAFKKTTQPVEKVYLRNASEGGQSTGGVFVDKNTGKELYKTSVQAPTKAQADKAANPTVYVRGADGNMVEATNSSQVMKHYQDMGENMQSAYQKAQSYSNAYGINNDADVKMRGADFQTFQPNNVKGVVSNAQGTVSGKQTEDFGGEAAGQVSRDGASSAGIAGKGQLPNGMWDPDYIPESEDEIMNAPLDQYTRQRWLGNFLKKTGLEDLDTSQLYSSFQEEAAAGLKKTKEETSALRGEIDKQKAEATDALKANQAANQAQFAADRNGIGSASNMIAKDQVAGTLQSRYDTQMSSFDREISKLDSLMAEQSKKYVAGREDQIRAQMTAVQNAQAELVKQEAARKKESMDTLQMLSESGALANLSQGDIAYLQEGLPGAPPGVVSLLANAATSKYGREDAKQRFEMQGQVLNQVKTLVDNGVPLTPSMMMNYAKQTGLPVDMLMNFNEASQQVMNDKTLDQSKKQMEIAKLGFELDRQARGVTNAELEKVDFIAGMYKAGKSPEEIAMAKRVMGVKDEDDPMYKADLSLKQAQAAIEQKKLRGEPVTIDDYIKLAEANQTQGGLNGTASAVVPNKSLAGLQVVYENGKYNIKYPPGLKMQCGEFTNRCDGFPAGDPRGVGSTYKSKTDKVDQLGFRTAKLTPEQALAKIKPGMNFVMPIAGKYAQYGHIGKIKSITPDGTKIITIEANADGTEAITEEIRPISQLYGVYAAPGSQVIGGGKVAEVEKKAAALDVVNSGLIPGLKITPEMMPEYEGAKKEDWKQKPYDQRLFEVTNDPSVFNPKSALYKELSQLSQENREAYLESLMKKTEIKTSGAFQKEKIKSLEDQARTFIKAGEYTWDELRDSLVEEHGEEIANNVMATIPKPKE